MTDQDRTLTHLDSQGKARMVDVSGKDESKRRAVAEGLIQMAPATLAAIEAGDGPKGEVLQVARIAGIQAGKRAGELIPLCHILPGASVSVDLSPDPSLPGIRVRSTASIQGQTGVEIEALTATTIALVTIYDMVKAMDRGMVMGDIRLVSKDGGASGSWTREKEL